MLLLADVPLRGFTNKKLQRAKAACVSRWIIFQNPNRIKREEEEKGRQDRGEEQKEERRGGGDRSRGEERRREERRGGKGRSDANMNRLSERKLFSGWCCSFLF